MEEIINRIRIMQNDRRCHLRIWDNTNYRNIPYVLITEKELEYILSKTTQS